MAAARGAATPRGPPENGATHLMDAPFKKGVKKGAKNGATHSRLGAGAARGHHRHPVSKGATHPRLGAAALAAQPCVAGEVPRGPVGQRGRRGIEIVDPRRARRRAATWLRRCVRALRPSWRRGREAHGRGACSRRPWSCRPSCSAS